MEINPPQEGKWPDITIVLEPATTIKINRGCYPIHVHLKGEEKCPKEFYVIEGDFE